MGIISRLAMLAYQKALVSFRKAFQKIPGKAGRYQLTTEQVNRVKLCGGMDRTKAARCGLLKEHVDYYLQNGLESD